jgi:hypothetical protein
VVNNPTDLPEPLRSRRALQKPPSLQKLILWVMLCHYVSKSGIDYESDLSNYGTC